MTRVVDSLRAEGEPLPLLLWTLTEELRKVMAVAAGQRPRGWLSPQRAEALNRLLEDPDATSSSRLSKGAHVVLALEDPWSAALTIPRFCDRSMTSPPRGWAGLAWCASDSTASFPPMPIIAAGGWRRRR